MAKALLMDKVKPDQEEKQKKRKKQAKKEAKLMLLVEKAKKGVQKAEQKATKAQANLQASKAQLQELEASLSQLHPTDQGTTTEVPAEAEQLNTDKEIPEPAANEQLEQNTAGEELQTSSSLPDEEGDNSTTGTPVTTPDIAIVHPTAAEEELTISSGVGSMLIVTHDENAWPPPQIREEIAESVIEEIATEHAISNNGNPSGADEPQAEEAADSPAIEPEKDASQAQRSTRRKSRSQV